jgi:hypothetical protein
VNHVFRIAALMIALGLIAQAPAQADSDTEGDWAGGWTSWKKAVKGDWAEYSSGAGTTRWEVLKESGGEVTYLWQTFDKQGKETQKKEKTSGWASIKLTVKLPYNIKVDWSEEELDLSGTKLACDVAKYKSGETSSVVYYCKDVPCGGFVKSVLNGKDGVWLSAFHTEKSGDVKQDPPREEPKSVSKLPRFYAAPDNSALIKITGTGRDATYQLRQVIDVAETSSRYTAVTCDEAGTPIADAKPIEREQKKEDWDKVYAKPSESGVKLTVAAGEFVCDVFKTTVDGKETSEWISEGAPIKKVIKSGETETVMEAVKITMK